MSQKTPNTDDSIQIFGLVAVLGSICMFHFCTICFVASILLPGLTANKYGAFSPV